MSYFKYIPNTTYELNGESFLVKDILKRSKFISEITPYSSLYFKHEIIDGESPQSLAVKYYKSASLYWVITVFNEIHNLYFDWPMSSGVLELFVKSKYGGDATSISHWEIDGSVVGEVKEYDSSVVWVNPQSPNSDNVECLPITFYEYEDRLNTEKRLINILQPDLLSDFVAQFRESLAK